MGNFKISKILVPLDFTECSMNALNVAISMANRQKAGLILLNVIDVSLKENTEKTANFKALAESVTKDNNVACEYYIEYGKVAASICRTAAEKDVDIIIIGTHGTSGFREFSVGSDTFDVVKQATCPVLTIPGNWNKQSFSMIIFPVRLVKGPLDKYYYLQPIVEKNNSEILIMGLAESDKPNNLKDLVLLADRLKMRLHEENVHFSTQLLPCKDFATKVLEASDKYECDLIVLTTELDYNSKAFFNGSFGQKILTYAKVPVLSK